MRELKLGDLSPTRDFNYVEDICRGILDLSCCDAAIGEVVNIGSNSEISIKNAVELIRDIMHCDALIQEDKQRFRPERSEVFRLWCDNTKIKKLTGYIPGYTLREGLVRTVTWFSDPVNLRKYKPGVYNL